MDGVSKPLKTATYLLRFTPEDKEELEQKVRVAAARGHSPLTLAEALRMGAHALLDELIEKLPALEDGVEARDEHVPAS
jgi:hypothetical protein